MRQNDSDREDRAREIARLNLRRLRKLQVAAVGLKLLKKRRSRRLSGDARST